MRQLVFSPRWIAWHLLTLGAMVTCGWLAAWQWDRAGSAMGSALNVGYGLQWPVFAIFFGVMWYRMLRLEVRSLRDSDPGSPVDPPAAEPSTELPAGAGPSEAPPSGPSPFGPRPARTPEPTADDDPELAEYNQMLAQLAARDAASTEGRH